MLFDVMPPPEPFEFNAYGAHLATRNRMVAKGEKDGVKALAGSPVDERSTAVEAST